MPKLLPLTQKSAPNVKDTLALWFGWRLEVFKSYFGRVEEKEKNEVIKKVAECFGKKRRRVTRYGEISPLWPKYLVFVNVFSVNFALGDI